MLRVYYTTPNEKPAWVADFNSEEFAQVLVNAGNRLYQGERKFYFEDSAADEAIETDDDDMDDGWCGNCSGTGEGSHDSARCWVCKGKGVVA